MLHQVFRLGILVVWEQGFAAMGTGFHPVHLAVADVKFAAAVRAFPIQKGNYPKGQQAEDAYRQTNVKGNGKILKNKADKREQQAGI